jgi:hypothetical protein
VSQVLTLYFTPVIYLYMERLKGVRLRRRQDVSRDLPSHSVVAAKDIAAE